MEREEMPTPRQVIIGVPRDHVVDEGVGALPQNPLTLPLTCASKSCSLPVS